MSASQRASRQGQASNLTNDGLLGYPYEVLNRLVKVKYAEPSGGADVTVAEYEHDGMNHRIRKLVQIFGEGVVPGSDEGGTITGIQAGTRHEHYYYAGWPLTRRASQSEAACVASLGLRPSRRVKGWRVIEERDNSDDVLAQTVWSTEYIDAPVCRDRNTDVGEDNEDYSSCIDAGSERYFYHQGPNYRVWALTDESGDVVERYDYDAYGEARLYAGHDSGVSAEVGNALFVSSVGNPYMHQGLRRDDETGLHENRMRAYHSRLGRFMQRDPIAFVPSTVTCWAFTLADWFSCLTPRPMGLSLLPPAGPSATRSCGLSMPQQIDLLYVDGMNLYSFDSENPLTRLDPMALQIMAGPESRCLGRLEWARIKGKDIDELKMCKDASGFAACLGSSARGVVAPVGYTCIATCVACAFAPLPINPACGGCAVCAGVGLSQVFYCFGVHCLGMDL